MAAVQCFLERAMDVVGAGMGLALVSPILFVTALLIRVSAGPPILFVMPRPGFRGRIFHLYKFRTMTDERGPDGRLLPDSRRLTPLGRVIRRLSLDELPQLWNVLKGDMSLVGPRPLLIEYLDRYTLTQARRHEVRPGITGWAQVNGRNAVTWEKKFDLDVWYVDHRSLWLDVEILVKTLGMTLKREGIWMRGEMNEPFMGSPPEAVSRGNDLQTAMSPAGDTGLTGANRSEKPCKS